MKISELTYKAGAKYSGNDFEVTGLAYDSRKVVPGNVFFALKGLKDDGTRYIEEAISKGASAIVSEKETEIAGAAAIRVENARRAMALFSKVFFGDPSSGLNLIGITGTNGKTTTACMTKAIFEEAGIPCGLIGTINYEFGSVKEDSSLTTPDSVELNMLLAKMKDAGMRSCVMEVSSIALAMDRVYGLNYSTALFTNLTSEHLDFHRDMQGYFNAKKILFDDLSEDARAITNADDEYGEAMIRDTRAEKIYYSVSRNTGFCPQDLNVSVNGISFKLEYEGHSARIESSLTGRFNVYNILSAAIIGLRNGIDLQTVSAAVRKFTAVKGRFNRVRLPNGATAVVDYSHTSDSLKNAIEAAKDLVQLEKKNGRVITIFGCGGNKDRTKRPVMGRYAVKLSDFAIITSDNPRFEDPYAIIYEIISGINGNRNFEIIEDRELAIKKGLSMSRDGDIVLICGKGHETYQEVRGVRSHFDDLEMVEKHSSEASA